MAANEVTAFIDKTTLEFDRFGQRRQNDKEFNTAFVQAIRANDLKTAQTLLGEGGVSEPHALKLSAGGAAPRPEWTHCFGKGHWYQVCVSIVISISTDPPAA